MDASLKPGQLLNDGEIEIIDLVGMGGIGEVYRASFNRDGQQRIVAIKCFNPDKCSSLLLVPLNLCIEKV